MKKCNANDHPYCTYRLEDGATVCAAGHTQKITMPEAMDSLSRMPGYAQLTGNLPKASAASAPHLHFSGYDPRAAGGRQMIKLELHGSISEEIEQISVQLRLELLATGSTVQRFERSLSGQWRPLVIAFSSKNKEYGQYQLEIELHSMSLGSSTGSSVKPCAETAQRRWTCSTIILVPPPETSLIELHRVFLGSQKNVKIFADDGSIAKLSGLNSNMHGNMDIEISAKNAALTQVELSAPAGKYEIALGSIAWDEELIEESPTIEAHNETHRVIASPASSDSNLHFNNKYHASIISNDPQAPSQIRLLALDHWVLGRLDVQRPSADVLLAHHGKSSEENAQLTRRISASHAIIRRTDVGAELIDVSRYGTLLEGLALKRDQPTTLKTGMHIELCASIKGIVRLKVIAILPHAIILQRTEGDRECNIENVEIFYLLTPDSKPVTPARCLPAGLPLLFHFAGRFWYCDPQTRQEILLDSSSALSNLPDSRYSNDAYENVNVRGFGLWRLASTAMPITTTTELLRKRP